MTPERPLVTTGAAPHRHLIDVAGPGPHPGYFGTSMYLSGCCSGPDPSQHTLTAQVRVMWHWHVLGDTALTGQAKGNGTDGMHG